jgi:ABC-type polysaccharide/polyol phosphate transport system ATPase subunit
MVAASTQQALSTKKQTATQHIRLKDVGVRYTILAEDQRTFKGRVLNLFRGVPHSARFWALRNLTIDVSPGEVVGIVGRNGSGKSTLLKVMSGVLDPTEGSVSISGRMMPILELGAAMNPELTGRENVYLTCSVLGISRAQADELIPQILSFSELGMFFDVPMKTYSSGMSARLAFSISTQIQPEIVILDEVLGVGDEAFQKKSYFRIRKLMDNGAIVVLVSHNPVIIEQLCNRVVYLNKGEVVGDGTPRHVLAHYQRDSSAGI